MGWFENDNLLKLVVAASIVYSFMIMSVIIISQAKVEEKEPETVRMEMHGEMQ
jgi:hypothetical protein